MTTYNEADYAQIDGFIHDRLPDDEKQIVAQRLQTDPDFAAEVTWVRNLLSGYQQLRTRETTEAINQRLRNRPATASAVTSVANPAAVNPNRSPAPRPVQAITNPVHRRSRAVMAWAAAASVVILLGISVWFIPRQSELQQAVAKQPKTSTPRPRTPTTAPERTNSLSDRTIAYLNAPPKLPGTIPVAIKPAVDALNAHHPDEALRLLQRIGASKPTLTRPDEPLFGASPESASPTGPSTAQLGRVRAFRQLYTGLSYLQKKQPALALHSLNRVNGSLRNTANWYGALCHLQLNQTENARKRLQQISTDDANPYRDAARELLKAF